MFHSVELRAHCHATEEEVRVGKAVRTVCPDGTIETEPAEGHHGNPILLMRCRIQKDDVIAAFWRRVKGAGLLDRILEALDERIDEDAVLHLRFDKQKAFAGAIELVLQLAVGDRDAEVAEVIRAARLDLIPGQDQAFPTGVNVGHHGRVTESFGNSQTRIEARSSGRRGAGQCQ